MDNVDSETSFLQVGGGGSALVNWLLTKQPEQGDRRHGQDVYCIRDKIVQIDESKICSQLDREVRNTVEQTINSLLDADHYGRLLQTKADWIVVKLPKLTFETAIIERSRDRVALS